MDDENIEWRSLALFRTIGHGLLILALFDLVNVFIPSRFTNPIWEFQAMGDLVEKSPVPLIGLTFVFFGKDTLRRDWEYNWLKFLSWISLVVGIFFFLLLPLGINNTIRLNNYNNNQINNRLSQQTSQIQQIKDKLNVATSDREIDNLFNALKRQSRPPDIKSTQELKNKLLTEIDTAQKRVVFESQIERSDRKIKLLKSSLKWNLGAIICGALFIYIWHITIWVR